MMTTTTRPAFPSLGSAADEVRRYELASSYKLVQFFCTYRQQWMKVSAYLSLSFILLELMTILGAINEKMRDEENDDPPPLSKFSLLVSQIRNTKHSQILIMARPAHVGVRDSVE
eukprot:scaffold21841_cov59-Cylindrotheca_fusiformis.AAC.1